jgi:diguanylate cyclase (GGDEF)-like protein/PAS domain S-box-containing protein
LPVSFVILEDQGQVMHLAIRSDSRIRRQLRLLGLIIIAFIILIVSIAVISLAYERRQADIQISNTTRNLASSLVLSFDGLINTTDMALLSSADEIARQIKAGKPNSKVINQFLSVQQQRLSNVSSLSVTNEHGDVLFGSDSESQVFNVVDRDFFLQLRDGVKADLFISKPIFNRSNNRWIWLFGRRITKSGGAFGGAVFAWIVVDEINKILDRVKLAPGSSIALRRATLELIARNNYERENPIQIGDTRMSLSFFKMLNTSPEEGTYVSDLVSADQVLKIYSYKRSEKYGFFVNVGVTRDFALAEWRKQMWVVTGLVSALIATAMIFFYFMRVIWLRNESHLHEAQISRDALRKLSNELDSIIRSTHAGIMRVDTDLRIVYVNKIQAGYFQRDVDALIGVPLEDVLDPRQFKYIHAKMTLALSGQMAEVEMYYASPDGVSSSHRLVSIAPERSVDGDIVGCVTVSLDITEKRRAFQKLEESSRQISELMGALDEHAIVSATDARGVITRVNDKFCQISQYARSELIGNTHRTVNSNHHTPKFFQDFWQTLSGGEVWTGEICNRAKDGTLFWVYSTVVPFVDSDGVPVQYLAIRADITERKRIEQEMQHLAFFDLLTGLPNRRLLIDRLNQSQIASQRSGQYCSLLFLDLDHFKEVNDILGHEKGDLLLKDVSNKLQQCVRHSDTVARFAGDEFVILLNNLGTDANEAMVSAGGISEKIIHALNQGCRINEEKVVCTTSIGIAIYQGSEIKQEELVQRADIAMYQAKMQGRNTSHFFDQQLLTTIKERSTFEAHLRKAAEMNELQLFYQPLVDETLSVVGVEALLRWEHPKWGMISPAEFIPVAEKNGMIYGLGQWVLKKACQQLAEWACCPSTANLTIAINVSAREIRHMNFVSLVLEALQQAGANPERLKLEITESVLLNDLEETIQKMNALRQHGVKFALDDFGTGYSSLSYLKKLPLDQLKVDQSFVRNVKVDHRDAAIVRTILSLAAILNLQVVAEGVETADQFDLLRNYGCSIFQGYLFGRPMSIDELRESGRTTSVLHAK